MSLSSNKKLSIIYILQILKDYSDDNHFLTQKKIQDKLENIYDMRVERKAISTNIDSLIDFGFDIIKGPKGCYFVGRELEKSEVSFLIDAVFSSKAISSKQAQELTKELTNFLSVYDRKNYKYLYKATEITRTINNQIFFTIDILNEAIEKGKKVQFQYNWYNEKKELVPKNSGQPYVISPYFMINNGGKYYVVCNYDPFNNISNFRIEFITNIKILDEDTKPVTSLEDCKNGFDISAYINSNIYMFSSKEILAKLKLKNNYAVNIAVDWFGKNISIYKQNNEFIADVKVNEEALIYWCLQYSKYATILTPVTTREKIKRIIKDLEIRYN